MAGRPKKKKKIETIEDQVASSGLDKRNLYTERICVDDTTQDAEVELVRMDSFPYMRFPYEFFNSMQSMVMPHIASDNVNHLVVCSPTSSGKTYVAEAAIAHANHFGYKGIYLSPLKALSNEKLMEWTDKEHDYTRMGRKVAILTGDFQKTEAKMNEIANSDMIVMTSEMLNSVTRLYSPTNPASQWLLRVGVIVIDEAHLIAEEERGDKLEALIMLLTEINPMVRIVALSATLPNVSDFAKWLSVLTGRKTEMIVSKFRPIPLEKHFCEYLPVSRKTAEVEQQITEMVDYVMAQNPEACYLIFVTSKAFGKKLSAHLSGAGNKNFFFSADLSKTERNSLHARYNAREFNTLIATNALAWGVNTPAKIVIVTSTRMGIGKKVSTATLNQEAGRAGRPQYDKEGKVFYFIPNCFFTEDFDRILSGEPIMSQMIDADVLAFHVLAEIHHGRIKDTFDLISWHKRSFAALQTAPLQEYHAEMVMNRLEKCEMIKRNDDGTYKITYLGTVTYQMYMRPEDMYGWKHGFEMLFRKINCKEIVGEHEIDKESCRILARTVASQKMYYSKYEQEHMNLVRGGISGKDGWNKIADCYMALLNPEPYPFLMKNLMDQLLMDSNRVFGALKRVMPQNKFFLEDLENRIRYGVPKYMLELCRIDGIGGKKAHKLWDAGIRTIRDFVNNHLKTKEVLGEATFNGSYQSAAELLGMQVNQDAILQRVGMQ